MLGRLREVWLPRALFALTVALSAGLLAAVVVAPWVDDGAADAGGWRRLVALFARDAVVRRTAAFSAAGLVVTAFVFFRPGAAEDKPPKGRKRPPNQVVGA